MKEHFYKILSFSLITYIGKYTHFLYNLFTKTPHNGIIVLYYYNIWYFIQFNNWSDENERAYDKNYF